jgi:uncharacterized protein YecT (DUF1311 family)
MENTERQPERLESRNEEYTQAQEAEHAYNQWKSFNSKHSAGNTNTSLPDMLIISSSTQAADNNEKWTQVIKDENGRPIDFGDSLEEAHLEENLSPFSIAEKKINKVVEAMQEAEPSTAGMIRSLVWATEQWDKELNRSYQAVMGQLGPAEQKQLREAQKAWIACRDLDAKISDSIYEKLPGTEFRPQAVHTKMNEVKKRAETLMKYEELLEEVKNSER